MIWVRDVCQHAQESGKRATFSGVSLFHGYFPREKRQEENHPDHYRPGPYDFCGTCQHGNGRFQLLHALSDFKHEFGDMQAGKMPCMI
jgi:hypothetical protein